MRNEDKEIYPTGTCFEDSLEFIAQIKEEYGLSEALKLYLVHALIRLDDQQIATHAWVETTQDSIEIVYSCGIINGEKEYFKKYKDLYYKEANVIEIIRYNIIDINALYLKHNHWGPWDERYRKYAIPND